MKKYFTLLFLINVSVSLSAQTTILSQNFSGVTVPALPAGWSATFTSGGFAPLGWTTVDTPTAVYDHDVPVSGHGTYIMVYEWGHPYNAPAILTSPVFSLAASLVPYLNFDYYYLAGNTGGATSNEKAWINISTDGGSTWTTIDTFVSTGFNWGSKYLNIAPYAGASSVQLQFVYTDNASHGFGIALDNIEVFDAAANDISLAQITPVDGDPALDFFNIGSKAPLAGTVFNHGTTNITSYNVTYQVGTSSPVTTSITGVNIAPFTTSHFTVPSYTVAAVANYPVNMWVKIPGYTNVHNDTATTHIYGYAHRPHKKVLFEEATGTWCCWCVRGIVYMDSLKKLFDTSVSIIAVHCQNDPMRKENQATNEYDAFLGQAITYSYPNILVDRYKNDDPAYTFSMFNIARSHFAVADMAITDAHITGAAMNVTVQAIPATDLDGDYRFALVITEDAVHNDAYNQENCYSYQSNNKPLSGVGYNFQDSLYTIPGSSMYYQYVARNTVPGMAHSPNGVAGSLPASMKAGNVYSYTFSNVPVSTTWDTKRLHVVVMLINNKNGYVYNTANTMWSLGVTDINTGIENMVVYPDPAVGDAYVAFYLNRATRMQVRVYDMLGHTIYSYTPEKMNSGNNKLMIPASHFPSGAYNISLCTETGIITQRFTKQ